MSDFNIYFQLGIGHILNLSAIDHLLFILSFLIGLNLKNFKESIYLVTAFTIGHSLTLALATLKIVQVNLNWIEFLIPATIGFSAVLKLMTTRTINTKITYYLICGFGLIHGLGFSNYLQSLLGKEASVLIPLIAFNLGVEIAQVFVVVLILGIFTILIKFLSRSNNYVQFAISIAILILSIQMAFERWP